MNKKKGFTLIEILMVVSIVSMLSTVIISSLGNAKSKGTDTAKINAIRQIKTALGMYYGDKGYYYLPIDQFSKVSQRGWDGIRVTGVNKCT